MHILLTNDDGIRAPGLAALGEAFRAAGHRITVCAPDRQRSATSHSVTLDAPLHITPVALEWAERAWSSDGTPADCTSLGLFLTRDDPVDVAISGINHGMNQGGACVYSGTVGAALEAAMCGTQALAVSLCVDPAGDSAADYAPAARVALRVVEWMRSHPLPLGTIYNLNVPPLPYPQIRGIAAATLAPVFLDPPNYVLTHDERGEAYLYRGTPGQYEDERYDTSRTAAGYASLTKLTWNFRLCADDRELNEIPL